jgi:hypothetical protein
MVDEELKGSDFLGIKIRRAFFTGIGSGRAQVDRGGWNYKYAT